MSSLALHRAIDHAGGHCELAEILDVEEYDVRKWARGEAIPGEFEEVLKELSEKPRTVRIKFRTASELAKLLGCSARWVRQRADTEHKIDGYTITSIEVTDEIRKARGLHHIVQALYAAEITVEATDPEAKVTDWLPVDELAALLGVSSNAIHQAASRNLGVGDYAAVQKRNATYEDRERFDLNGKTRYLFRAVGRVGGVARRVEDLPDHVEPSTVGDVAKALRVSSPSSVSGDTVVGYTITRHPITEDQRKAWGLHPSATRLYSACRDGAEPVEYDLEDLFGSMDVDLHQWQPASRLARELDVSVQAICTAAIKGHRTKERNLERRPATDAERDAWDLSRRTKYFYRVVDEDSVVEGSAEDSVDESSAPGSSEDPDCEAQIASDTLVAIADEAVEDLMATPDEELRREMVEDGKDPDVVAEHTRSVIGKAVAEHALEQHGFELPGELGGDLEERLDHHLDTVKSRVEEDLVALEEQLDERLSRLEQAVLSLRRDMPDDVASTDPLAQACFQVLAVECISPKVRCILAEGLRKFYGVSR